MNVTLDILKFFAFFLVVFLIPGYVLTRNADIKSNSGKVFIATVLGFALSTVTYYLHPVIFSLYVIIPVIIFIIGGYYKDFRGLKLPRKKGQFIILGLIVVLGTFFQNNLTFRTGLNYEYGIGFWSALAHDGVWHQALIAQLTKNIPPLNPALSGFTLTNYHYFYDLLLAVVNKITLIPIADLVYRYFPIIFSVLLGFGSYLLTVKIFKKESAGLFAAYFSYFGSSFGWIVELFRGGEIIAGESNFWANQPVSLNINPPFAISLIFLITVLYLFSLYEEKRDYWLLGLMAIIAGLTIEFKVYGGLIILSSLLVLAVKKAFFDKDRVLLVYALIAIGIAAGVFIPNSMGSTSFVTFVPFWIIHSMIDIVDRVGWWRLSLSRTVGLAEKDWVKFIGAEGIGLILFILGNIGTRMIAFAAFLLIPIKEWFKNNSYLILVIVSGASVLPTLLFVQKSDPWNIIQFTYYFLFIAAIVAAYVLSIFFEKSKKSVVIIGLTILFVITPLSSLGSFRSGFQGNPTYLDKGELEALNYLKTQEDGVVLTYPYNQYLRYSTEKRPLPLWAYQTSAYVSAYSHKVTYLEDTMQQGILDADFKDRIKKMEDFFTNNMLEQGEDTFIKDANITYVYIPQDLRRMVNTKLPSAKIIFENEGAVIFKYDFTTN